MAGKRCWYCGQPFTGRGRTCCPEHQRKLASHEAAVQSGRARARDRQLGQLQLEYGRRRRWSAIAMGQDVAANLAALFKLSNGGGGNGKHR